MGGLQWRAVIHLFVSSLSEEMYVLSVKQFTTCVCIRGVASKRKNSKKALYQKLL